MDIPRSPEYARKRRTRRIVYVVLGVAAVVAISIGVSRLKPAAPSVDFNTLWPDTVKRGDMLRQVRGLGTLVPIEIRVITTDTDGVVERRLLQRGMKVTPDTVLVVLESPELKQAEFDAESQLQGAEAGYKQLQAELQSALLDRRATAATAQADYQQAKVEADTDASLAKKGLVSQLDLKLSQTKAEGLASRDKVEQERYEVYSNSLRSQLAVQQAKIEQAKALVELKRSQLAALNVRAGITGVLTDIPVEEGQRVTAGTVLAKVVQPEKLKADLKIPETQAKDIALGQPAEVDTHNGVIPGHVIRIDPAAVNGTVDVDVALDGPLPQGARPDLSVEGTIDLERLTNVLYVGRPAFGQENSTVSMFKIEPDGKEAVRVPVRLGRASVSTVEILSGLKEGDQVILSDMSQMDAYNRIRLNR